MPPPRHESADNTAIQVAAHEMRPARTGRQGEPSSATPTTTQFTPSLRTTAMLVCVGHQPDAAREDTFELQPGSFPTTPDPARHPLTSTFGVSADTCARRRSKSAAAATACVLGATAATLSEGSASASLLPPGSAEQCA